MAYQLFPAYPWHLFVLAVSWRAMIQIYDPLETTEFAHDLYAWYWFGFNINIKGTITDAKHVQLSPAGVLYLCDAILLFRYYDY